MGLENEAKITDFEKLKSMPQSPSDVVVDVATLLLWCRDIAFGVKILKFACLCNVVADVATFLL